MLNTKGTCKCNGILKVNVLSISVYVLSEFQCSFMVGGDFSVSKCCLRALLKYNSPPF